MCLLTGYNQTLMTRLKILLLLCLLLAACRQQPQAPAAAATASAAASAATTASEAPQPSPTPFQPSPTPEALAARVNGEGITLQVFQSELARYTAASASATPAQELSPEEADLAGQTVLNSLIDETLLAQAAAGQQYWAQLGFADADALVQARLDALVARLGSAEALQQWMAANGYLEPAFRSDLARAAAAAWMRDQIASQVATSVEQVHARQILAGSESEANAYLAQLQAGADFAGLAAQVDPVAGGELGWFPRGYLLYPELDEPIFALADGQYSAVLQTPAGYHLVQVIERQLERPLSPDALLQAQKRAVQAWLTAQRSQAQIEILR